MRAEQKKVSLAKKSIPSTPLKMSGRQWLTAEFSYGYSLGLFFGARLSCDFGDPPRGCRCYVWNSSEGPKPLPSLSRQFVWQAENSENSGKRIVWRRCFAVEAKSRLSHTAAVWIEARRVRTRKKQGGFRSRSWDPPPSMTILPTGTCTGRRAAADLSHRSSF